MNAYPRRRGVILVVVLLLMSVVLGFISVLAVNSVQSHRRQQTERVRLVARAVADSAAAYARTRLAAAPTTRPSEPLELDVTSLLPPRMTGTATLTLLTIGDRPVCRVTTRVESGGVGIRDEIDIDLTVPSATRPAN